MRIQNVAHLSHWNHFASVTDRKQPRVKYSKHNTRMLSSDLGYSFVWEGAQWNTV